MISLASGSIIDLRRAEEQRRLTFFTAMARTLFLLLAALCLPALANVPRASSLLTEKAHTGFGGFARGSHRGLAVAKPLMAPGFGGCLRVFSGRSRSTGKERDAETGLDYFGARYFSGAMGRFTSPDPSNLSVDWWVPQSWNRYAYALNNPLAYVDDNGLWPTGIHNRIINQAFPGLSAQQL